MEVSELAPMHAPLSERPHRGFVVALDDALDDDAPLGCRDVRGFREATLAAQDARAPAPARLALVAPDDAMVAWLERWAEDAEHVRRRFTLRRADGAAITVVATIASFGAGIPTSLAVESIGLLAGGPILRSGVHSRAEVEAALARYDAHRDVLDD
jgi:hypothetical protein